MQAQFYKITSSLNQKLKCKAECFVKVEESQRKYRKVFLSDVYLYIVTDDKVKCRINILKIQKIFVSKSSSEFVVISNDKAILIDSLPIRGTFLKEVKRIKEQIEIIHVKEPLLDQYLQDKVAETKQQSMVLDLHRLRNAYWQVDQNTFKKKFDELFQIKECINNDEYHSLVIVEQTKVNDEFLKKKKKKKKNGISKFTVKIYPKEPIGKDKQLLKRIFAEKQALEEIMSPYFPVLYKCMYSKTYIYCLTEYYTGQPLESYISNETLNKHILKNLLGQITIGIGQLHQCNLVYNNVSLKSIFVTDKGYVMFNDLSLCKKIQSNRKTMVSQEKDIKQEFQKERKKENAEEGTPEYDWFCFGKIIFQIKEGKKYNSDLTISEYKEKQLTNLVTDLLSKTPSTRLGFKNDYYEVLGHQYFKGINKKDISTQSCEPLKKFFHFNHSSMSKEKFSSLLEKEDWSVYDDLLKDYEFSRELQD